MGDGLAAYYYAVGRGKIVAHTENSLFETLRYFGAIFTTIIYLKIIYPTKNFYNSKIKNKYFTIFGVYLLMSLANPIFFNSVGALVILWY